MTFLELQTEVQNNLNDTSENIWTLTYIKRQLNFAQQNFAKRTGFPFREKTASASVVAYQYDYSLASDFGGVITGVTLETDVLYPIGKKEYDIRNWDTASTGDPTRYLIINDDTLRLDIQPDDAAGTTTLNGAIISTSATTITVVSTTNFPNKGRIIIDSEVIIYTNKTSTTFAGCTRGAEGTAAATHLNGTTATERNLVYDYWSYSADMSANGDISLIPTAYHEALTLYAIAKCWLREDKAKAGDYFALYEKQVKECMSETGVKQYDEFFTTLDNEMAINSNKNLIPPNSSMS